MPSEKALGSLGHDMVENAQGRKCPTVDARASARHHDARALSRAAAVADTAAVGPVRNFSVQPGVKLGLSTPEKKKRWKRIMLTLNFQAFTHGLEESLEESYRIPNK